MRQEIVVSIELDKELTKEESLNLNQEILEAVLVKVGHTNKPIKGWVVDVESLPYGKLATYR